MIRITQLKLPLNYTELQLRNTIAKKLRISTEMLLSVELRKRSLDARKKPDLFYVLTVDVTVSDETSVLKKHPGPEIRVVEPDCYQLPQRGRKRLKTRPVIAGSGPAGLFCALMLARAGYCPVLLERGESVEKRTETVQRFWDTGELDEHSNIQFGEGGAGTFSDGKLNTLVKDPAGRNHLVLQTFVEAGADPEILYVSKPHIGTDVLRGVVAYLRQEILRLGGDVRFESQVTDLVLEGDRLTGIILNHEKKLESQVLVAAVGHSARDTFAMLRDRGVSMQPKSFAVGLRIEHPQTMINRYVYGVEKPEYLPAADYKVTRKLADGRGVYSFCMCPGGYVVNASSEKGHLAVNGMSYHARDGQNANSALIVTVTPEDFGSEDVLGGVQFQRRLEKLAWQAGGGRVPVQLFCDFQSQKISAGLGDVIPCIRGGWRFGNLREALPGFLGDALEEGILGFERQIPGFSRPDAVLSGVESRTSSPVRILRDASFQSNIRGLYPCGEGAGYAGGITSAAMDGVKAAEAIIAGYDAP